ncbi:transcriptional elongation regulator MINIYO isoform X2 [Jatropha curcas]|nr:transcriptional elongation regulator MINIYO isoform X2 [Jatropha curcas]
MSPEEIAEAQAEIMGKLDPALINLFKKRGQEKMKPRNLSRSDKAINGELGTTLREDQTTKYSNVSSHVKNDNSDTVKISTSMDKKNGSNNGSVQDLGLSDGTMWNSWSDRVEAVRILRFSIEGNVIAAETETGDISIGNKDSTVSVSERDFLRTEGDPAAVGYTIKEAVQLTRSVIPGQRALALHLLASVLDKAIYNIQQNQVGCTLKNANLVDKLNDWEAIWAYALGPEPELVLSLRMCLDDNHSSVVLACARVIHCALSCDLNENFFDISERIAVYEKVIFTGPVFRSKPEPNVGFLRGGFWKYNAKPSNILTSTKDVIDDETEGEHTIQDDLVVASQDFAAGLVRMGILPRMLYLLEADHNATLEEYIISILIAITRHSPTCANAIMKCHGLVDTVVRKFTMANATEIHPIKIKSVKLLKVLAQSDRNNCSVFINNGSFQAMIQHLFRYTSSLDHWVKSGKESCKLLSALMVEQLRFWRACIDYGFCVSYFSDIFPALCLWLNPPTFNKLLENNVLSDFFCVSREAYLVLEALARRLPSFYSQKHLSNQISDFAGEELETWSWSFVTPMVDLALKWIASRNDPYVSKHFESENGIRSGLAFQDLSDSSFLWVFSAVMHMLSTLLERVNAEKTMSPQGSSKQVPWLPEFVPKIGLEIIKNLFLSSNGTEDQGDGKFVKELCHLRQNSKFESSLASVCCLHGLLRVITSIDNLITMAMNEIHSHPSKGYNFSREGKILEDGILKSSMIEWRCVLNVFMKFVGSEWHAVQSIEVFGRGGPAPGLGVGWGASGGGFWSMTVLLAQTDARLLIYMLEIIQMVSITELSRDEEMAFAMHRVNSLLGACLIVGPRDRIVMENVLDILLQVPVLKYLDFCVQRFLPSNLRMKPFRWEYKKEDYLHLREILASHFKNRWLSVKKKLKATDENISSGNKSLKKGRVSLATIHEDLDTSNMTNQDHSCTSLTVEWAHQRLPLPMHWFLSPISVISGDKHAGLLSASDIPNPMQDTGDIVEVAKAGLFFLLAMEAMSTFLSSDVHSPIRYVPLVWKLHSLSVILLVGMDVLDDNRSRDVYEALQDIYGQLLDEARYTKSAVHILDGNVNLLSETEKRNMPYFLKFQSEIQESYSTFLETLVEQFSAVSYGDFIFGRQVAVYLHRSTESAVRLSAWNLLSNARVLEILPPLDKCIAEAEGYLEPIEDNEAILEAYMKSWVSGALDRSAVRGSMAYSLVLHHLSFFIFFVGCHDKISLRNKLVKSLLRDYSQKQKREGMMLDLVQYPKPHPYNNNIEKRFEVLAEACDRNSVLMAEVEKLRSAFVKKLNSL